MKLLVRSLIGVITAVFLVLVVAYAIGRTLPEHHVAEGREVIAASVEQVVARIRDVAAYATWRSGIDSVVLEQSINEAVRYRERSGGEEMALALYERAPGRFESVIVDQSLPFGGRWLIELEPVNGDDTEIRIREEGIIRAPLFRTISRYVIGHEATLETYLADLKASFSP